METNRKKKFVPHKLLFGEHRWNNIRREPKMWIYLTFKSSFCKEDCVYIKDST